MFILMDDKQYYNTQHIMKYRKTKLVNADSIAKYHRYTFTLTDGSEVTQTVKANSVIEDVLLRNLSK